MKKLIIPLLLSISALSYAEMPSDFTMENLESMYIKSKSCEQDCGLFTGVKVKNINTSTQDIVFEINLSASSLTTVTLPLNSNTLIWNEFLLNGKPTNSIINKSNKIIVAVQPGSHILEIHAKYKQNQKIELLEDPKNFENLTTSNINLQKIGNNFFIELETSKITQKKEEKEIEVNKIILGQPLYKIERELFLSDKWKLKTTVSPIFSNDKLNEVIIPLLEGENILNNNIEVVDNNIKLSLTGNTISWESSLQPKNKMVFENKDSKNLEKWIIYNENNWLYSYKGVNPINQNSNNIYKTINTWLMWPKEQVEINFTLPSIVNGKTSSVTNLTLSSDLLKSPNEHNLQFMIESSIGGRYNIKFEDKNAKIDKLTLNNGVLANQIKDGVLALDLIAGQNQINMEIKSDNNNYLYKTPQIKFETDVTNARFSMPINRWILLIGGGDVRPAVLLWGFIAFFTILAFGLSKIKNTPLKFTSWILLFFGLCETNYWTSIIIISWILSFSYRDKIIEKFTKDGVIENKTFNRIQLTLGTLSILGLLTLLGVVATGLLDNPDMFILGSNYHTGNLDWYIQTWNGENKNPWIFSLPLNYYKIIILCWAVWLAFSIMSWLKWMWTEYSKGGYWKKKK